MLWRQRCVGLRHVLLLMGALRACLKPVTVVDIPILEMCVLIMRSRCVVRWFAHISRIDATIMESVM